MPKDPPIDRLLEKIHQEQLAYHKRLLSSSKEEIPPQCSLLAIRNGRSDRTRDTLPPSNGSSSGKNLRSLASK